MKMRVLIALAGAVGMAACAQQEAAQQAPAAAAAQSKEAPRPAAPAGGGLNGTPEQQAKQAELEKNTPKLKATEEVLRLSVPGETIGEAVGVAKN